MSDSTTGTRVEIRGFTKESTELVREMESFGWTFRPSNHGVVGRAPNDKTTISISRNLRKSNRSHQAARGDFRRWLRKAHPEMVDVASQYIDDRVEAEDVAESNPVIAGILERRALVRAHGQMETLNVQLVDDLTDVAPSAQTDTESESEEVPPMATVTLVDTEPVHAKTAKDDFVRVLKRTWSSGRVDFICSYPDCRVTSTNPRSVSQHYGAAHTRPIETYIHRAPSMYGTPAATEPEPEPQSEPEPQYEPEPTETEPMPEPVEPEPVTEPEPEITKQYVEAGVMATAETLLPDAPQMVMAIQGIVARPLLEQVKILAGQVETLTKERDEAVENLAKLQQDWDALRSLIGNR